MLPMMRLLETGDVGLGRLGANPLLGGPDTRLGEIVGRGQRSVRNHRGPLLAMQRVCQEVAASRSQLAHAFGC